MSEALPPFIKREDKVILFDGVCKLCSAWSNFIIKHDKAMVFKLCSVQSVPGKRILSHFNYPIDTYETMLYVEGACCYEKSDAFTRVIAQLDYPWKLGRFVGLAPKTARDWCYSRVALNRYSLFGRYQYCSLPTPDHQNRYLSSE